MKFEDYHFAKEIKQSLNEMNFKRPTDIQFKAIPSILKGEDVLAIAQTGTGKTAAFAIPILHKLHYAIQKNKEENRIKCLVMVPTRELALQITEVFTALAVHTELVILCTFGGVSQDPQIEELSFGIDVLISTPGRMFDLRSQGHIDISKVEILVLDEADHMLALGFLQDIHDVVRHLPRKHQTLFFSATIDEKIKEVAYSLVHNAIRIQISPKDPVSKNVDHAVAFIEMDDKRFFLERIIRERADEKILVFVRTKVRAERVQKAMDRVGIETITLHGDKNQEERFEALENFKQGIKKVLIATDLSARGIDVAGVKLVINYDLPDVAENYVHRVGRTGRGVEKGQALSFCSPEEKDVLTEIESFLDKEIKVMQVSKSEYSMTKILTNEAKNDWQKLINDAAIEDAKWKSSHPKKNKKK
ncbi:MAG: DEAD/DEAH box helicase [Bacteroidetes bacterium]|nr:DEAD/DEAH box helicase [Bacteroidota bacterium]